MTNQQPLTLDQPVICQCWLGDGKFMCPTPRECGLLNEGEK